MEEGGLFFDDDQVTRFTKAGTVLLHTAKALAWESLAAGELRWPLRPKFHAFSHIIETVAVDKRNPKLYGCMLDEDMLGQVVRASRVCHRLVSLLSVVLSVDFGPPRIPQFGQVVP